MATRNPDDHVHVFRTVRPGRAECNDCGARLAVETATQLGPSLRGSDIAWANDQMRKINANDQT